MSGWIKVIDRLPKERKHVLISYDGITMEAFCRRNIVGASWFKQDGAGLDRDYKVTHWQSLPRGCKGKKWVKERLGIIYPNNSAYIEDLMRR